MSDTIPPFLGNGRSKFAQFLELQSCAGLRSIRDMPDKLDQFESVFKSADMPVLTHDEKHFREILVVSDQQTDVSGEFFTQLRESWPLIERDRANWRALPASALDDAASFVGRVENEKADLIVTHRYLAEQERGQLRGLGSLLGAIVWQTSAPVLILPCDETGRVIQRESTSGTVLAATDHLTGDNVLVDYGVRFTPLDGRLVLAHIEDDAIFERFMAEIERIPQIETDVARRELKQKLLQRPQSYIQSCQDVLRAAGKRCDVSSVVRFGHRVRDYHTLIGESGAELLCLHAGGEDVPAQRGMAHMIATQFRNLPLFLI